MIFVAYDIFYKPQRKHLNVKTKSYTQQTNKGDKMGP